MFARSLDVLAEEDLDWLITNKVRETRTLDYKRQMYGDSTDEKRKMLRDVASMANAEGGVLVLGMDEDKDGAASELLPVPNAGVEADRLIKVCNAFIAERFSAFVLGWLTSEAALRSWCTCREATEGRTWSLSTAEPTFGPATTMEMARCL